MALLTRMVTSLINSVAYCFGRCNGTEDEYHLSVRSSFIEVPEYFGFDSDQSTGNDTKCCVSDRFTVVAAPLAGSTTTQSSEIPPHPSTLTDGDGQQQNNMKPRWVSLPSSSVHVRGTNYVTDKKKAPSPSSLYELIEVDVVDSKFPLFDISEKYDLSQVLAKANRTPRESHKTWLSPNFLVISFNLPHQTPKIGKKSGEGGYIVTGYFRLRGETREVLQIITNPQYSEVQKANKLNGLTAKSNSGSENNNDNGIQKDRINAVKLWEKWCRTAPHDPEMQKRLKFIFRGDNLREIGVPSWICKYNGKPMLIKRPGVTNFVFSHPQDDRMEIDINLHPLPFMFKQAMSYMKEHYFKDALMTFGFVIEGRSEDELPEVLLGNPLTLPYNSDEIIMRAHKIFVNRGLM